jgi:hypothetical protein
MHLIPFSSPPTTRKATVQVFVPTFTWSELCYDRRSAGKSVLVSSTHLRLKTGFLFLSDSCGFVDVGRPLWREDGPVAYNCCWTSPARLISSPNPAGLMTISYCLRFENSPTWKARSPYLYPPETGWPSYSPQPWVSYSLLGFNPRIYNWIYSFGPSALPMKHHGEWHRELFRGYITRPAPPGGGIAVPQHGWRWPHYITSERTAQKTPLPRVIPLLFASVATIN